MTSCKEIQIGEIKPKRTKFNVEIDIGNCDRENIVKELKEHMCWDFVDDLADIIEKG